MRRFPIVLALSVAASGLAASVPAPAASTPNVVVAMIDTGINPYSPAFRDDSSLAQQPPSTYLRGYPSDCTTEPAEPTDTCAVRLELAGLSASTYADAYEADRVLWSGPDGFSGVRSGQLYYIPGTKIVGAISMRAGGQRCARSRNGIRFTLPANPLGNAGPDCPERVILDDHGHGTMTASRATGAPSSLAPTARVVMIEGLGSGSSMWAASQPWIDVQSNSWGSLIPAPADTGDQNAFETIGRTQLAFVASGNGVAFSGVAPTPTWFDGLGAEGIVLVGGHDNGYVTAWAGTPTHVVADAYAPMMAIHDSLEAMRPDPVACCTSTAAPYAAGGGAALLLDARTLLGDTTTGWRDVTIDGVVRRVGAGNGTAPAGVTSGPLADGYLTLDEARDVLEHTAEALPSEGRDDGWLNYTGAPGTFPRTPENGLGDNPYCEGCTTLPYRWKDAPEGYPAYTQIGYGAVNEFSIALAAEVLRGTAPLPSRPEVDEFFRNSDAVRDTLWQN